MQNTGTGAGRRKGPATPLCSGKVFRGIVNLSDKCRRPHIHKISEQRQVHTKKWFADGILAHIAEWATERGLPVEEAKKCFDEYIICAGCNDYLRQGFVRAWNEAAKGRLFSKWAGWCVPHGPLTRLIRTPRTYIATLTLQVSLNS